MKKRMRYQLKNQVRKIKKDKISGDDKSSNNFNFNLNDGNIQQNLNRIHEYIAGNKKNVEDLQGDINKINERIIKIEKRLNMTSNNSIQNKNINNNLKLNNISNNTVNNNNNVINNNINNNIMNKNNVNNKNVINNNRKMKTNNFNEQVESKNLEAIASKIELMGSTAQNLNPKFNDNKNRKEKSFSRSLSENIDEKEDEISIEELGEENKKR